MSKMVMGVRVPSLPPKVEADPEIRSDAATIKLIRGRGFALTFSSHFAVAVIVGVLGWVYAQQRGEHAAVPDDVTRDLRELKSGMAALQADFAFFKATRDMQDKATESKLNELIARSAKP